MSTQEIQNKLPKGFRGSALRKIIVRNRVYELRLYLDIDTGSKIKTGILTVIGLVYFILDDSEADILSTIGKGIRIPESGTVESMEGEVYIPGSYDEEAFRHYFYLPDFRVHIFVSGKDCEFEWEV